MHNIQSVDHLTLDSLWLYVIKLMIKKPLYAVGMYKA